MKLFLAFAGLLLVLTTQHHTSFAFSPSRLDTRRQYSTLLHVKHVQKAAAHHEKWQPYFDRLTKYRDQHPEGDLSDMDDDLHEWLQDQRKQYHLLKQGKKVRLTKKRAMALERAGAINTDDEGVVAP